MPTSDDIARLRAYTKRVIGKPWEKGALGPDAFFCWGLVRDTQQALFGRELPIVNVEPTSAIQVARALKGHEMLSLWPAQDDLRHGDVVTMRSHDSPGHVGTFLDVDRGGILHCVEGAGVRFDGWTFLRAAGWHSFVFHRPAETAA